MLRHRQLTEMEMNEINVLLTEVSLELLGNQFYDIYGQRRDTLRELYTPGIARRADYPGPESCDLIERINEKPIVIDDDEECSETKRTSILDSRIETKPSRPHNHMDELAHVEVTVKPTQKRSQLVSESDRNELTQPSTSSTVETAQPTKQKRKRDRSVVGSGGRNSDDSSQPAILRTNSIKKRRMTMATASGPSDKETMNDTEKSARVDIKAAVNKGAYSSRQFVIY